MSTPSSAMCGAIKQNTQIEEGLLELSKAIENLDDLVSRIGDKLSPVLRPESLTAAAGSIPESSLVPLAEELRSRCKRINRVSDQVHSWLGRIEL